MNVGLTFDKIHSTTKGLTINNIKRPILPTLRKRKMIVPGRHGSWDFENNTYDERIIIIECSINGKSLADVRNKARELASWFRVKGKLIFDDEPDKYYIGRTYSSIDPEQIMKYGKFTLTFECEPFAYYLVTTGEDILLNSDMTLDSDITLDNRINYLYSITADKTIQVDNIGTFEVRPKIEISGTFSTFIITINGKNLTLNEGINNEIIIIDNENYTVKKNELNKLGIVTGDLNTFLELIPGINSVSISGTALNCTVLFDFRPLYL